MKRKRGHSELTKAKMRAAAIARYDRVGRKPIPSCRVCGKKQTVRHSYRCRECYFKQASKESFAHYGADNHLWRGGITPLYRMIRNSERTVSFRVSIFERDQYRCQECFKQGVHVEAHHKKSFSLILRDFLKAYSQFSPVEDKDTLFRLALEHKEFWDESNMVTLCKSCHSEETSRIQSGNDNPYFRDGSSLA